MSERHGPSKGVVAPDPGLPAGRLGRDEEGELARPERGRRDDGRGDRGLLPLWVLSVCRGFGSRMGDRQDLSRVGGDRVTTTDEGGGALRSPDAPGSTKTKSWYIVHTYSGFEERVRQNRTQRVDAMGMSEKFGEIRIPTETLVEMKGGKRREVQRKFFPGYIIIDRKSTRLNSSHGSI